jgi:hypothetical protein
MLAKVPPIGGAKWWEDSMRHSIRTAMVAVLVVCFFGAGPWVAVAQGNVVGTVYTSPTFGYQLQWSAPWFFIEETSESGFDSLLISDGASNASFGFTFAPGMTLQGVLDLYLSEPVPGFSNMQPMLDAQGVPLRGFNGDQEWAAYTADQLLDDGSTIQTMWYFNLRTLEGGVILLMTGLTVSYFWDDSSLQNWHNLANSILVVDDDVVTPEPTAPAPVPTATATSEQRPGPDPTATGVPDVTPTATPDVTAVPPLPGDGEPAPAFAAGPWRISVRAVDLGESIDYLGLGFVDGNQWVVVYADITNWSEADAQLDAASLTLATTGGPVAPDAVSTQSAASLLGLEPANGSSVQVPAGGATRVALVYSIPVSESELVLSVDDNQLPLEDAVGRQFDVTDLSTIATPPGVQEGTVGTIPLDGAVQFFVDDTLVKVAGIELPSDTDCTDASGELLLALGGLYGKTVWLEADPAVTEADTYYVWYEDDQGNRVLLNQTLLADGLAIEGDLPEDARFGAWLEQTENVAQSAGIGMWEPCT